MEIFAIVLVFLGLCSATPLKHQIDGRIINGILATKGQFPYQVAVIRKLSSGFIDRCGGALISPEWVLTSARCVLEKDIQYVNVILGSTSLSRETDPSLVSVNATKWIPHEKFYTSAGVSLKNDVGLVKLPSPVTLTDKIKTIALNSEPVKAGTAVTISGWGYINATATPNDLRFIVLKTVSQDECLKAYEQQEVQDTVCTVPNDGTIKTICAGDIGGPLVTNATNGLVHIGIASFGVCGGKFPDGYSRTDINRAWIKNITGI